MTSLAHVRAVLILSFAACGRIDFAGTTASVDATGDTTTPADADIAQSVPPGARIWLRMETDPTTTIVDSAGNHVTACTGTCPTRVAGKHGYGYQFHVDEVDVQYASDLDASAGFTAALWIDLSVMPSTDACIWSMPWDSASGYDTFSICIDPALGQLYFKCEEVGGIGQIEYGPNLELAMWHHLAMSWDGTTMAGYLDGANVANVATTDNVGTEPVMLGGKSSMKYVQAIVDDAMFYTRQLTDPEIAQLATP